MNNKSKELSKLYALRTGLSVISQKNDRLDEDKKKIEKLDCEINKTVYTGKTKIDVDNEVGELIEKNKNVNNALKERFFEMYAYLKNGSGLFFRVFLSCFGVIAVETAQSFFGDMLKSDKILTVILGFVLTCFTYLFGAILSLILEIICFPFVLLNPIRIKKSSIKRAFKKDKCFNSVMSFEKDKFMGIDLLNESPEINDNITTMLDALNYQYAKYDNIYLKYGGARHRILMPSAIQLIFDNLNDIYDGQKKEGYEEVERLTAKFEEDLEEKKTQYVRAVEGNRELQSQLSLESNAIKTALEDQISSLLDIRDWGNLDLIIYYYETGRADTIKEALQLVDLESRGGNLNIALRKANKEIGNSIKSGNYRVDENILAELGTYTQQELEKALFDKSNITSAQMAEQLKKLSEQCGRCKNIK